MTWGINGAGPLGVPPVGPGSPMVGSAGANYPPLFNASFESIMAAVSRGEVSLNQVVAANNQFGGVGNAAGNPTLMQAISQGNGQNGTNGLNGGPGGGTINSSMSSTAGSSGTGTAMGGTQTLDAKQTLTAVASALANPIQYGGA